MRKVLVLLAGAALWACAPKAANRYTIDITAEDTPALVLLSYASGDENRIDTAALVDGRFHFEGTVDEPLPATLIVNFASQEGSQPMVFHAPVVLEPGRITVDVPARWDDAVVGGTPSNDEARRWNDTIRPILDRANGINAKFMALTPEEQQSRLEPLRAQYMELENSIKTMAQAYVAANPDSWFALSNLWQYAVSNQDPEQGQRVLDGFSERVRATKLGRDRQASIDAWRAVAVGAVAPEFAQADPEGQEIKLSDFRGKWLLIDFWASWCAPCRKENPNVVAAYEKFKERGFEILGVSLDSNKDAWVKAIADDKLVWPQVGDLQGWGNAVAKAYSIANIPSNLLLNPDGVIVAKNLRGEELPKKLEELLGE